MKRAVASFALAMLVFAVSASAQEEKDKDKAPDFPPGLFNDGQRYSLRDLEGKAVVLFFYEQDCPRCRGMIPARNQVVAQYKDKPIKFIAIAAGDSMTEARAYLNSTHLQMPVFADTFSMMEKRYGTSISLQNIWQFRVIGPDGKIAARRMEVADIDKVLANVKWKYKDGAYDKRLDPVVDRFEWGLYAEGMRLLRPHLKNSKKEIQESAQKLYAAVSAEGQQWMEKADQAIEPNPVEAYDLYNKTATAFAGDDLGKKANEALKKLAANQAVKDELAARKMYDQLCNGAANGRQQQREQVKEFAQGIAKKYPNTPTGQKAAQVAQEL
jgi:peroxiredoxin